MSPPLTLPRGQAIARLARWVADRRLGHPIRVAIDGVTASGKTTVARELATAVSELGRPVIQVSMDGFHHPRARRHRQGRESALGYYEDASSSTLMRSRPPDTPRSSSATTNANPRSCSQPAPGVDHRRQSRSSPATR
jgi:hypothetical protein